MPNPMRKCLKKSKHKAIVLKHFRNAHGNDVTAIFALAVIRSQQKFNATVENQVWGIMNNFKM